MIVPYTNKFALVGHGYLMFHLFNELKKYNFEKPIIITHHKKFHKRDINESKNDKKLFRNIFDLKNKTKIFCVDDINKSKTLSILKKHKITHLFSISSRFIFKKKIIKRYQKKIFNIHGSLLPNERGAGTYTYRIFNSDYFCCSTIHIVNEGVDKGQIILQSKKEYISKNSLPYDFLIKTNNISLSLIKKFTKMIYLKRKFKIKKQKEKKSTYLPRFYTNLHGVIDFNLKGIFIEKFIKGCSHPYSGSHCYISHKKKSLKLRIFNAKFIKNKKYIHPFLIGKIVFQNNTSIKVLVSDGFLLIKLKDIKFGNKKIKIRLLGKTLYNVDRDIKKSHVSTLNVFKYK